MRVVIDTNILCKAAEHFSQDHIAVMVFTSKLGHYLVLDHDLQLFNEYQSEVGNSSLFQKWYQEMQGKSQIYWANGHISHRIARELKKRCFHEPEDHVVVALAIKTDKYIVTEDSDFGKDDPRRAAEHQAALAYLTNNLGLTVHDAGEAYATLRKVNQSQYPQ